MNQDELDLRAVLEPTWYRIEARHWSVANEWGDHSHTSSELVLMPFKVVRHTPKGAWLEIPFGGKKFVLRDYQHRGRAYAAPSSAIAKEDFRKRKQFRIDRLQHQINRAEKEIAMLDTRLRALAFNAAY